MNLEPLRTALTAQIDAESRQQQAEIDEECRNKLAAAVAEANELARRARREGDQAAALEAIRRRAIASRRGRELRLEAQRTLLDELRLRALEQALELRTDPEYHALLDRLARAARSQLGTQVTIDVDPPGVGGVIGRAGRRSVDYSLRALVQRAIESLDGDLDTLWQ